MKLLWNKRPEQKDGLQRALGARLSHQPMPPQYVGSPGIITSLMQLQPEVEARQLHLYLAFTLLQLLQSIWVIDCYDDDDDDVDSSMLWLI